MHFKQLPGNATVAGVTLRRAAHLCWEPVSRKLNLLAEEARFREGLASVSALKGRGSHWRRAIPGRAARSVWDGEVRTKKTGEVVCARWKGSCYSGHLDLMVSVVGS